MERWAASGYKLPALSGAMLGASYYAPVLVFNLLALVPLLYWLERNESASRWFRLRGGLVAGVVAHLIGNHFILSLTRFSWLAGFLYPGLVLALGLKVALIVTAASSLRRRTGLAWVWLLPVTWITADWLMTFGDLRLTADHFYHGMAGYPFLIQFADLAGPHGVTAFVLVVNALAYEALLHWPASRGRRGALALAGLLAIVLAYDGWAWTRPAPDGRTVRVGIVQPNVRMLVKWSEESNERQWETLVRLSRRAVEQGAEWVVWPETAYPWPVYHWLDRPGSFAIPPARALAMELGVPLILGAEYVQVRERDDWDLYNAAMVVTPDGLEASWVAKAYLVPFTEQLPFKELVGRFIGDRNEGQWRFITGGFKPAPTGQLLRVGGVEVGALVCYEQLFADLPRKLRTAGAGVQLVITNDAWFGRTAFQRLQVNAVRLRAIESRSDFVRAANTGISGFVDRKGRLFDATRLYEEAVIVREVAITDTVTVYDRVGDVVAWLAALGLGVSLVMGYRRRG